MGDACVKKHRRLEGGEVSSGVIGRFRLDSWEGVGGTIGGVGRGRRGLMNMYDLGQAPGLSIEFWGEKWSRDKIDRSWGTGGSPTGGEIVPWEGGGPLTRNMVVLDEASGLKKVQRWNLVRARSLDRYGVLGLNRVEKLVISPWGLSKDSLRNGCGD